MWRWAQVGPPATDLGRDRERARLLWQYQAAETPGYEKCADESDDPGSGGSGGQAAGVGCEGRCDAARCKANVRAQRLVRWSSVQAPRLSIDWSVFISSSRIRVRAVVLHPQIFRS